MALVPGQPERVRRLSRAAIVTFACVVAATLPACLSVQPAASAPAEARADDSVRARATAPGGSIWPERWGDENAGSKGVVAELPDPAVVLEGRRVGRFSDQRASPEDRALIERFAQDRAGRGGYRFRLEGPGSYVFEPSASDPPETLAKSKQPEHALVFLSAEVAESAEITPGEPDERVVVQRTWAHVLRHRRDGREPEPGDHGRGLVVVAPGLFGVPAPVIGSIVHAMRTDGWNVLRVLAPPARFTERADLSMVSVAVKDNVADAPRDAAVEAEPNEEAAADAVVEADLDSNDAIGKAIRELDAAPVNIFYDTAEFSDIAGGRMAEYAYACEAFVRWVRTHRPDLFPGATPAPAPLIAMSAGAISGPAIIGRAPDLYAGTLLIAAGGDFLSVTIDSNYTELIDAVRFDWTVRAPDEVDADFAEDIVGTLPVPHDVLSKMYLDQTPLDPMNLAPALADRRFVMLHGTNDRAVPAEYGDRLWEALGKPERWVTPLDHGPLFVGLFLWTPRIIEWLDTEADAIAADSESSQRNEAAGG